MTQEEKELLFKDLCARLPYGVKVNVDTQGDFTLIGLTKESIFTACEIEGWNYNFPIETIKPYLFPLSSMTEEQLYEVSQILGKDVAIFTDYLLTIDHRRRTFSYQELDALFNWLDKNHFDHRGLIPMGLAIDATGLDIY